ncbi:MAG: aminotransferase class IV [Acidobacteriia bacterium]|nr:aminotransferase class IV [Terriglobia bacterium]
MGNTIVWLNGKFVEYGDAKIPIEDRGFQFSDGVYEVVRGRKGRFFALGDHLGRLRRSLQSVEIEIQQTDSEISEIAAKILLKCGADDCTLYIQVTRGVFPRQHGFPPGNQSPTMVMLARPFVPYPTEYYSQGVEVITLKDERWMRCDIKSIGLLANVLARGRAGRAKAAEAILVRESHVTEGSSSNVFAVKGGILLTPIADQRILGGVTRDHVLKLARASKLPVEERNVSLIELREANEVFLTSTTLDVLPVVKIDHFMVGNGRIGNLTSDMMRRYQDLVLTSSKAIGG